MSEYCRENAESGIMFLGHGKDAKVYALCEKTKTGKYELKKNSDVSYQNVLSFFSKKLAIEFCRQHKLPQNRIIKFGNRFENIWALRWGVMSDDEVWVHTKNNFAS